MGLSQCNYTWYQQWTRTEQALISNMKSSFSSERRASVLEVGPSSSIIVKSSTDCDSDSELVTRSYYLYGRTGQSDSIIVAGLEPRP